MQKVSAGKGVHTCSINVAIKRICCGQLPGTTYLKKIEILINLSKWNNGIHIYLTVFYFKGLTGICMFIKQLAPKVEIILIRSAIFQL